MKGKYGYKKREEGHYIPHEFGSRNGYWIVHEDGYSRGEKKQLSVWRYKDGKATPHAGPCKASPFGTNCYIDPVIDAEPKMFGSDWDHYVRHGKANLGCPTKAKEEREKIRQAQGRRVNAEEVLEWIDKKKPSVTALADKFSISVRSAYRWLDKAS